ncbi:hypothetical protein Mlute_02462 [Meiothermus luteus]|uniref:Uncharacterized protein n=1 Tax=Meiothermus luteus TaxID=2026184 RepID=A0A399EH82_9DEIN|nr:hypothetical protein Mlute_02462 [Meiothermus luteus]
MTNTAAMVREWRGEKPGIWLSRLVRSTASNRPRLEATVMATGISGGSRLSQAWVCSQRWESQKARRGTTSKPSRRPTSARYSRFKLVRLPKGLVLIMPMVSSRAPAQYPR